MLRRSSLALAMTMVLGCAAPDLERPKVKSPAIDPIDDPYPDVLADPYEAVVRVVISRGSCSGALVAPDLVLTARHCLLTTLADKPNEPPRMIAPKQVMVGIGGGYAPRAVVSVRDIVAPSRCGGAIIGEGDLAFLILARKVRSVTPLKIRTDAVPIKGEILSTAGFGMCHPSKMLARQVGPLGKIEVTNDTELRLDAPACPGDSGSPAISWTTREIVGVVSGGLGPEGKPDPIGLDWILGRKERPYATLTRLDAFHDLYVQARNVASGLGRTPEVNCVPK